MWGAASCAAAWRPAAAARTSRRAGAGAGVGWVGCFQGASKVQQPGLARRVGPACQACSAPGGAPAAGSRSTGASPSHPNRTACPPPLQARKTFQKLIYTSNLVFGDRQAAFLLPWTRVFGLTDAQVRAACWPAGAARALCAGLGGRLPASAARLCPCCTLAHGCPRHPAPHPPSPNPHAALYRGHPLPPQVYVAKRDGAKNIFRQFLDSQGGQLQVGAGAAGTGLPRRLAERAAACWRHCTDHAPLASNCSLPSPPPTAGRQDVPAAAARGAGGRAPCGRRGVCAGQGRRARARGGAAGEGGAEREAAHARARLHGCVRATLCALSQGAAALRAVAVAGSAAARAGWAPPWGGSPAHLLAPSMADAMPCHSTSRVCLQRPWPP